MELWRVLAAVFVPPIAVVDKGCGALLLVAVLTMFGWLPGVIAALLIGGMDSSERRRYVDIPAAFEDDDDYEKPKRKGAYMRLADGEIAQVIEDDGSLPQRRRRLSGE